jgi:hypothetical protein
MQRARARKRGAEFSRGIICPPPTWPRAPTKTRLVFTTKQNIANRFKTNHHDAELAFTSATIRKKVLIFENPIREAPREIAAASISGGCRGVDPLKIGQT